MRLVRNQFFDWLRARPSNEIVGVRGGACECPIARYYRDASGGHEITVLDSDKGIKIVRGDGGRLAPEWAERFVRFIDDEPPEDKQIEAWRAIQLLEASAAR